MLWTVALTNEHVGMRVQYLGPDSPMHGWFGRLTEVHPTRKTVSILFYSSHMPFIGLPAEHTVLAEQNCPNCGKAL